ncbi:hydroxyisourate hydrolase [Vibrio hippocampi]|uniref:5-hydroxyisourate hydrolase n=1 Tax=Vibrio hippocampi TaxID=654686 RepID=A0ABM8ZHM0_9VIBR|nr:hydroxyisourate hydrolase [Vibrio hippocampi]CAH0526194.1 5-hydroxyisourate hydrolase [Vibrio hippocampi]
MSRLSCHVLDTSSGHPAAGIRVTVYPFNSQQPLASETTDADGRARFETTLPIGENYTLSFEVADYCQHTFGAVFFPLIEVHFHVADSRHHHVPVLLSPYSYSTYRGS